MLLWALTKLTPQMWLLLRKTSKIDYHFGWSSERCSKICILCLSLDATRRFYPFLFWGRAHLTKYVCVWFLFNSIHFYLIGFDHVNIKLILIGLWSRKKKKGSVLWWEIIQFSLSNHHFSKNLNIKFWIFLRSNEMWFGDSFLFSIN